MTEITGTDTPIKINISPVTLKISLDNEKLTTLLRSNISCHLNKTLNQELMEQLTAQIVESIDYFINKSEDNS